MTSFSLCVDDTPRREAARIRAIWGIGHRQPAYGWWWQVPARRFRHGGSGRLQDAPEGESGQLRFLEKFTMSDALDAVKNLTAVAEKLLLETERLRRDVVMLNARVEPIEGWEPRRDFHQPHPKAKWPIPDALNMIDTARASILNSEHELSAIRARIDNIASDAISRHEMKPWIKDK
jgi:hypothetical protein